MPSFRTSVARNDRSQVRATALGYLSETFPITVAAASSIPTANAASGTLVAGMVGLRQGDVVTNTHVCVSAAGTSLTFAKLGLFDASGNFLAATASVSATFNSGGGVKTVALTSPYTIGADGGYYVGFLQYGSGATGAGLYGGISPPGAAAGLGGPGSNPVVQVTLQTDITGNVTFAANTQRAYWFGVS